MGIEKDLVENPIKKLLTERGAWFFKVYSGAGMAKGIPDIVAVYHGFFMAFENKKPTTGAHITYVQKKHLMQITQNGGIAVIPQSVDFVEEILDAIDNGESLKKFGYQQHGRKELVDDAWLEECIW